MSGRIWWAGVVALALALSGCRDGKLKGLGDEPDREGDANKIHPKDNLPGEVTPVIGVVDCSNGSCTVPPAQALSRATRPNPIPGENAKPGNADWMSGNQSWNRQVELYASTDSAAANDHVKVRVSTSVDSTVTAEVYRIGYYGGAGARKLWSGGPYQTTKQAACALTESTARVECSWTDTFEFTVDPSWVSGLYVIKIKRSDNYFRFAPLVVRDDRAAEVLFSTAVNTYHAYNYWGGESLYADGSGKIPSGMGHEVSFDRPYDGDNGAGQQLRYEAHLARFLEKNGYDVTYATNLDFVRFSHLLDGIAMYVHGGHDEYWNPEQRAEVDRALATGNISMAYFGANGAYWRTRVGPNSKGEPNRTLICWKAEPLADPIPNSTLRYRDDPINHPESQIYGSLYDGWQITVFPLVVKDASNWLFEGTGLTNGTLLQGLVGYEFDRLNPDFPAPPGTHSPFESPILTAEGLPSVSHVTERAIDNGHIVFSAGTIYWPIALSPDPLFHDGRIERMTLNVMEKGLEPKRPRRTLPPPSDQGPSVPAPDAHWAAKVEALAGVPGTAGNHDGPADQATFNGPTAMAYLPTGEIAVSDTVGNQIRLIGVDPASTVTTIAGDGRLGYKDGPGATAMFRSPIGIVARADGSLLVADSDNHVIRKLTRSNGAWTVSLYAGVQRKKGNVDGALDVAKFDRPTALAQDAAGNVYVVDQAGCKIRRINAAGTNVTTLAGGGPGYADAATGSMARFNYPSSVAVTPAGDALYVFDAGNQKLRKISTTSPYAVVTLAGGDDDVRDGYYQQGGSFGFKDGPGDHARFLAQSGIVVTAIGEVLLADAGNNRIRKVIAGADAATTNVYTIGGSGRVGKNLGTGATADIVTPAGMLILPNEKILISDPYNGVIRVMTR